MSAKISILPTRSLIQNDDLFVLANETTGLNYKIRLDDLKAQFGDPGMTSLTTLVDEVSSSVTYIGKALPTTLTTAPNWQIQRITITGNDMQVEWAASGVFSQIWDNRSILVYS